MNGLPLRSGEYRIRDDLGLEFIFDTERQSFTVEWTPDKPRKLSGAEIARYRRLRNHFLGRIAERLGGAVAVVEL